MRFRIFKSKPSEIVWIGKEDKILLRLAFNLTLEDIKNQWDEQNGICPYTNFNLKLYKPKETCEYHLRASLDRIDSSKGYVKGNIEFISLPINYLKSDQLSKNEVFELLTRISSNFH